ncbi:MAG: glutamine-hydrolyzing GMP synthase, partial [Blastocatellia bacterium]|nr:glutamine-hydrolyzing GMP synthase [Blastocatellia bacterium]
MGETQDLILILDFGSQYTQLIARRIRELNTYCEIIPFNTPIEKIKEKSPSGLVFSGGPSSVYEKDAPHCSDQLLKLNLPILGICYGFQLLANLLGGKVSPSQQREYGAANIEIVSKSRLFTDIGKSLPVWMSHGDYVSSLPSGFKIIAQTDNALAAAEDPVNHYYGLQFHPEVVHTSCGKEILANFLSICGSKNSWTMSSFIEREVAKIKEQVGNGHVICGLSGGVDSSVAAALVDRAIGSRLTCLFIDNGLLRKNEFHQVLTTYRDYMHLNVIGVAAGEEFLTKLAGVTDPEKKRKIIGHQFIEVFQHQAQKLGHQVDFLVQGTLYPDVIESVSVKGPSAVIKSHHNVGGLPEQMHLKLIEPLRELFKDEVRLLGRELAVPEEIIGRQPFPGPGLAVRILGEVTLDRITILQDADAIVQEEIIRAELYDKIWQAFAVLLPVQSVGVMGDSRTYENACVVRAVHSQDGMTADWAKLPYDLLHRISSRIVSEVRGINRVVYDISSKPPSTIEWE